LLLLCRSIQLTLVICRSVKFQRMLKAKRARKNCCQFRQPNVWKGIWRRRVSLIHLGSISPTYLRTAFTPVVPKSVRILSSCQYLFTLLGSTGAKAERRTLTKLTLNDLTHCFVHNNYAIVTLKVPKRSTAKTAHE